MDTDAARHPERFTGLIEHLERHAGPCSGAEPPTVRGGNRGYALAYYELPDGGPATVVSNGLRFQPLTASLEQELLCTVHAEFTEAARHLVDVACGLAMEREQGLADGTILNNGSPLLADTEIHGLIASVHPFFPEEFDLFHDADGALTLRLLTLVPAAGPELAFATEHGVDSLWERWSAGSIDLLDVERGSAV